MAGRKKPGALALVLHSHMPYVEGFGTWPFGEEWLFEALATVYVPLLETMRGWADRGRRDVVTLGLTPVLCDQLEERGAGERFVKFVDEVRRSTHRADIDGFAKAGDAPLKAAALQSWQRYEGAARQFSGLNGDLLAGFGELEAAGTISLWTSCATHPVLPLLATRAGARLQIGTGVRAHRRRFGGWQGGFWLPECAYTPAVDGLVGGSGGSVFCVNPVGSGDWREPLAAMCPVQTDAGPVAVPIDWPTVELVWSNGGYPAHADYLDYHHVTDNGLRIFRNGGGVSNAKSGAERARHDAADFVANAGERLGRFHAERGRPGLLTCALDTELLGHWWSEGLIWLDRVVDECESQGVELVTLPAGLGSCEPALAERGLPASTWGKDRNLSTWDSPAAADLVWGARRAELELVEALHRCVTAAEPAGQREVAPDPAAERAARELLALQSSDWAFMITRKLADGYPLRRFGDHLSAFGGALSAVGLSDSAAQSGRGGDGKLRNLAPDLGLDLLVEPGSALGRHDSPQGRRPRRQVSPEGLT